jgi:hypothetical protein
MRRIWSGARTHLRNGKPISIEGRWRRRGVTAGNRGVHCVPPGRRGDHAFGRPCPPEFVERVHDGVVSQRESRTRAVKASREVVCPILRGGAARRHPPHRRHFHTPPRQDRRRAPLRLSLAQRRAYAVTREAARLRFLAFLRILSPLYGRNCSGIKEREKRTENIFISFFWSFARPKVDYCGL